MSAPAVPAVVLLASLANVVVLADATIVVVALPSLGAGLGFSPGGLPWVVNSYSLAFGGCLVLGGYAADRLGPRLPFGLGMALFALGSFGCAAAGSPAALVWGRVLQGVGGALFSPAALAVVTRSAGSSADRVRALAVWSGAGAAAVAAGPVLGGALTAAWAGGRCSGCRRWVAWPRPAPVCAGCPAGPLGRLWTVPRRLCRVAGRVWTVPCSGSASPARCWPWDRPRWWGRATPARCGCRRCCGSRPGRPGWRCCR